jgi:putative nucleotidyltransferase with HDIG domain
MKAMISELPIDSKTLSPLDRRQIELRLDACPRLPSLRSIDSALRSLLNDDQRYISQIAEIIRRDPSLTARLLRLVNSVYYGMNSPVSNLEEAVFYLGLRQIRQLVMVTPIIEDFQKLAGNSAFSWRDFWRHCIGTAILTREVCGSLQPSIDDTDYVAGLVHDVGKIVMASAFPDHFHAVYQDRGSKIELVDKEKAVLGIDHAELGALYLQRHNLPAILVETARYHHHPDKAGPNANLAASVQIADLLMNHANSSDLDFGSGVTEEKLMAATGWSILFPQASEKEILIARGNLRRSVDRLPCILDGLI